MSPVQWLRRRTDAWRRDPEVSALVLLAAATMGFATYVAVAYCQQPLLESFGFRQTQTALSAYWMQREGWQLAYQTPIGGAPWTIPFEFPLYQAVVAGLATILRAPLDPTGRLVSFAFLVACLVPASAIAMRLALSRVTYWVFSALFMSSPLYVFWGRTFMIETSALFFCLSFAPFGIDVVRGVGGWRVAVLSSLFLSAALLQKSTTALPPLACFGVWWTVEAWREWRARRPLTRRLFAAALAFACPLAIAMAWTRYADAVKLHSMLGRLLAPLTFSSWYFGTPAQRWSDALWSGVVWRVLAQNGGGLLGVLVVGASVVWCRRRRSLVASLVMLTLLPFVVFTNVHIVHDYYRVACVVFWIAALSIAVGEWWAAIVPGRYATLGLTLVLCGSNYVSFFHAYWPLARERFSVDENATLLLASVLRDHTDEKSAFVGYGLTWSSEVPYYARRKSFMVTEEVSDYLGPWQEPQRYLGGLPLGGFIICPTREGPSRADVRERFAAEPEWVLVYINGCHVLLSPHSERGDLWRSTGP